MSGPSAAVPVTAKKNIDAITRVEQQLHGRRSTAEKVGDGIARFFGSLWFVAAHVVGFGSWIALNVPTLSGLEPFDPYPYPFLGLLVGIEFIFLTAFVLMNQNLASKRQEKWGHLTLQVGLLTEQEVTKNMQMIDSICRHLGLTDLGADQESAGMAQTTPLGALVEEIEKARGSGE
jgi:uncharacterized membrane protein